MSPEQLWASWRSAYIRSETEGHNADPARPEECVFCKLLASGEANDKTYILRRSDECFVILNAYPYTNGHLMVMPLRHVSELEDLSSGEATSLWALVTEAVRAIKTAYSPNGINFGANLGRAAGAGIPGHLHVQCLPRWVGDTSFMTSVSNTRILNESLDETWSRLDAAWPS